MHSASRQNWTARLPSSALATVFHLTFLSAAVGGACLLHFWPSSAFSAADLGASVINARALSRREVSTQAAKSIGVGHQTVRHVCASRTRHRHARRFHGMRDRPQGRGCESVHHTDSHAVLVHAMAYATSSISMLGAT
jgi:hypothetical protein